SSVNGDGTAAARPRTRGLPQSRRRTQDAGTHPAHPEDGKAVEELGARASGLETRGIWDWRLMNIVDRGEGPPIVVIPGVQGRWEWMQTGIDALARYGRVITFSLAD